MVDVYIGFSKPKSWFAPYAWIIRAIEKTKYSHTYLRWTTRTSNVDCVYQASGRKVNFEATKIFLSHAIVVKEYKLQLTNDQYLQLVGFCMSKAGVPYGALQVVGILIGKLFNLCGNVFKNGTDEEVCSELVSRFLSDILGKDIGINPDIATPRDIDKYLEANGYELHN